MRRRNAPRPAEANQRAATESIGQGRHTNSSGSVRSAEIEANLRSVDLVIDKSDLSDHFGNVRLSRGGFVATCPAHDDRVGVLTIIGDDVTCHRGCSTGAVFAAVGLVEP
jgi:hypothetical protein